MIRQINLNNDLANLKELLRSYIRTNPNDPDDGMFYDVTDCTATISGTQYTGVRATAMIGETEVPVVDFFYLNTNRLRVKMYYQGTTSTGYYVDVGGGSSSYGPISNKFRYAYATDNGFMIYFEYYGVYATHGTPTWVTILVTKGNDGYPFIVLSAYSNNSNDMYLLHTQNIVTCHVTDDMYLAKEVNPSLDASYQNALCPFMGYGDPMTISYTPYAYWMPIVQPSVRAMGFAVMKFNEEMEGITDGYWVIFDNTGEAAS